MKKTIDNNSIGLLKVNPLCKDQLNKIKGGTGDAADDIVIADIITP